MKKIVGLFDGIDKVMSIIASFTLFVMMVWIFLDVTLRYFFNSPIQGTIELTGEYLMVLLVYLAISQTQKHDEHVRVTFLEEKFSEKMKKVTKFITNILAAPFFLFIAYLNLQEGLEYLEQNIKSVGVLDYPLAPALFIISVGLLMIGLRLIIECVAILFPKLIAPSTIMKPVDDEDINMPV
ncbi:TRAP transporter small permease [Bacillus dakarensis]|uniref:TRAP transporter small permease n=1 Tax=Robertmurraya dakarensis TaxID=1926278 RepID=UPI0009812300|nr:TRAP transporter small permease [Bacillus dakarensis]